jgi:hypothetical protein
MSSSHTKSPKFLTKVPLLSAATSKVNWIRPTIVSMALPLLISKLNTEGSAAQIFSPYLNLLDPQKA